jgi:hypothetical protein
LVRSLLLGSTTLALANPLSAQQVATLRPTAPAVSSEAFTEISGVRVLTDGRLIVADRGERRLALLSPDLRRLAAIGRVGDGPGEFRAVAGLVALQGDSTLLHDDEANRFLPIAANGRIGAAIMALGGDLSHPAARTLFSDPELMRGDATGRICVRLVPTTPTLADSSEIVCGARTGGTFATVARVRIPERRRVEIGGRQIPVNVRLSTADGWALASDGAVAVVRSAPYRVEWRPRQGAPVIGPVVPVTPIQVTATERQRIEAAFRANAAARGPSGVQVGPPGQEVDPAEAAARIPVPVAEIKGPFDPEGIVVGPGRELWVLRRGRDGEPPTYDVFDAAARLRFRVPLAPDARLLAVTAQHLYVARVDADGLEHLERWQRPVMPVAR